jgi:multiple sugar transport system substrate-binding protein
VARAAVERRAGPRGYAILLPLGEWQTPVILAMQLGAGLLREEGRYGDFESEPFRRAFDFYLGLFRDGLAPVAGEAQVGNLYQDFAAGFFAFYVSGPWNLGEFERRLPPPLAPHWTTAPMPAPEGGEAVSIAGGASLAVFRSCEHPEAAWRWVEYLSATERQAEFFRLTGDLPARRSAWRQADIVADPKARAFWQQLQNVRSTPKVPEWERIADKLSQYAEAAVRGEMDASAALAALDAEVDAILAKRRWMLARGTLP